MVLGIPEPFRTHEGLLAKTKNLGILCHWILSPAPLIGLDPCFDQKTFDHAR